MIALAALALAFAPAPGWTVLTHGPSQPYIVRNMVVAVTTPDAPTQRPFLVFDSLPRLRPDGILIWADAAPGGPTTTFTPGRWPLSLTGFRLDHAWEGQPAPNVQQRLRWAAVRGWHVEVRVYFATQHPSRALVTKAQAEIDRIVLPRR